MMPSVVPTVLTGWMRPFQCHFTVAVWRHVLVLVCGTLLAPGRRTVAAALRVLGLSDVAGFAVYRRVLSHGRWCSRAHARLHHGGILGQRAVQENRGHHNHDHHHSGLGLMTPDQVHYGQADDIHAARQRTLDHAFAAHPERFVNQPPSPPAKPTAVWINPPSQKAHPS